MATRKDIADIIFPDAKESIEDLKKKYPPRKNLLCSRFAPSPTGFLHIGGLYSAFVSWKFVKQNKGIFIVRIEDTDQKREIENGINLIIDNLKYFGIDIDEGPIGENNVDIGNYGPYIQSKRKYIYQIFVKTLIEKGLAYPCWMSENELNQIREQQTKIKVTPGIYGNYSIRRKKTPEEILTQINKDKNFVIRFRSHGDLNKRIIFDDIIKGKINMIDNYNDIVLIKSDGLPTYHLAHIADDHLMRVSHVIRGEERLTSVPLHLQLFNAFEIIPPLYSHIAPLLKLDEGNKRKLSKRKDPEANIEFFFENGYSIQGIIQYLLNLIDPKFEERQKNNSDKNYINFEMKLEDMNKSGALFDIVKLQSINNNYLSKISTDQLFVESLIWAKKYKLNLAELMEDNIDYTKQALNIERHTEKDPKRFVTYQDIDGQLRFFYDKEREKLILNKPNFADSLNSEIIKNFISEYIQVLDLNMSLENRFEQLKQIGKKHGFASNNAEFKEGGYIGKVGDLAMLIRIQLCCTSKTPDLFSVMKVMGKDRVMKRLSYLI
ncbi:MAG: glutamate--tRNA ligase [Candidatus Absconditabacterales bacterium]